LEVEIAREIDYVSAARKAVGKGLGLLYSYLQDGNASEVVAKALAFNPERKVEIIPLLERAQASITDGCAKEEIQVTLAKFREANWS
jgi:hypothetical protein